MGETERARITSFTNTCEVAIQLCPSGFLRSLAPLSRSVSLPPWQIEGRLRAGEISHQLFVLPQLKG